MEAFYQRERGRTFHPDWRQDDTEVGRAEEYGLLTASESSGLEVNEENRKIRKAIGALNRLRDFTAEASKEFKEWYENECDEDLDLSLRPFWQQHLGLF